MRSVSFIAVVVSVVAVAISLTSLHSVEKTADASAIVAEACNEALNVLATNNVAVATANQALKLASDLRTQMLQDKLTDYLMGRKVRNMSDRELALLLRTPRYEEAAKELAKRREIALKSIGKNQQKSGK